jgi:hypothetical protein
MKIRLDFLAGSAIAILSATLGLAITDPALAEEAADGATADERMERVEAKVDALTDEVGRLESIFAVPEELEFESFSGLGPAASKVYKRESGLSIGGYGEVRLRTFHGQGDQDRNDVFDALRAIVYVGYKFNEKWVFNSELEFEHAGSGGGGSVSTEFLTIDYLHRDELNFRAGVLLIPMGFVNEIHEPNFFYGSERPEVERQIMPSTWRENGAGIFGTIADDFAFVGRVDVDVADGLLVGGSVYAGQSGQEQRADTRAFAGELLPDLMTHVYEIHAQYKGTGFSFRGPCSEAFIDEAGAHNRILGSGLASRMQGWYVEGGYDILPLFVETKQTLEPFFRFSNLDTQHKTPDGVIRDATRDVNIYTAGLHYRPIPQVVFKVDYRRFDQRSGSRANEVQALVGYVF